MRFLKSSSWFTIIISAVCIAGALLVLYKIFFPTPPVLVTTTVDRGTVRELVSVSGFIEAAQIAKLAFPATGRVTGLLVEEGSQVEAGQVIATLGATTLVAERNEAEAALSSAEANYRELASGPRSEAVSLSNVTVERAKASLDTTITEEGRKVNNARASLLSSGLTATALDPEEDTVAPLISGTYRCLDEGQYEVRVFRSNTDSGYSYTYSGLEAGTSIVSTNQPAALGTCGLFLQFSPNNTYADSEWIIAIPNQRSEAYTSLLNAYNLTVTQAENAIALAKKNLSVAESEATLTLAPARSESLNQAEASISQAKARIAAVDARLADLSVIAPFSGIVTEVDITLGETASNQPVITVVATDAYTLKARIPEIDITKLALGQEVTAVFDARSNEVLTGTVSYISPIANQIDGVAYFEITVELTTQPNWLRAGLNADIDIIIAQKENVLRLPKRFVTTLANGEQAVLVSLGNTTATTSIEVLFVGNDSYLEISGITEGTTVIAP